MKYLPRVILIVCLIAGARTTRSLAQDDACKSLNFRSNFRVNGAQQHISLADGSAYADTRRREAQDAIHTLTDAVRAGQAGGADPLTTWFFFGRAYLLLGDLTGADSALTKVSQLAHPDDGCDAEVRRLRHNAMVPLQQQAVGMIQSQNYDSALVLLRRANMIDHGEPDGFMNIAAVFMSKQQEDSAAAYYRMAMHAGRDPSREEMRSSAALNAARLLSRSNRLPAAESVYREYVVLHPRDMAARGALATTLSQQHRPADAAAVYDSILASADSLTTLQLFDTGVSLFNLAAADSARGDSAQKAGFFRRAARAFEASAQKSPSFRDAWYNLTNTYLALGDTPHQLEAAKSLLRVDSMSVQNWNLLASGYQTLMKTAARRDSMLRTRRDSLPVAAQYRATARAYQDSTLKALQRRDSLPFQVIFSRFDPRDSTASLRGVAQNLKQAEHPPFTLVLEFVNQRGDVVATERVEIPALNAAGSPGQAYDFNIQASGRGIVAYRYKVS